MNLHSFYRDLDAHDWAYAYSDEGMIMSNYPTNPELVQAVLTKAVAKYRTSVQPDEVVTEAIREIQLAAYRAGLERALEAVRDCIVDDSPTDEIEKVIAQLPKS